jgi:glycosyltransferase involved in cell wall biosynthesis
MKYCFAAPHACALFDASSRLPFGGAEVRAWMFGTALARRADAQVSFVVYRDKAIERERVGDVLVWRQEREPAPGGSVVSRIFRRITRMLERVRPGALSVNGHRVSPGGIRVFSAVDADVYCAFGASNYAAELAAFCRARGRRAVLFVSSDDNLSRDYAPGDTGLNVYGSRRDLCHYALTRADLVITQTERQREMLKERFGRDSITIRNPIRLGSTPPVESAGRTHVLWIGKADTVKRPDILLRLAAEFPRVRFTMVLNRAVAGLYERTVAQATPNLEIREFVPYAESDDLFRRARVLVNTSRFEGFPNTFLQAGKSAVPVLSLEIDPDGFIARNGCGIVAGGDYRRLAEGLAALHEDEPRWRACSASIAAYVRAHHDLGGAAERLRRALTEGGDG